MAGGAWWLLRPEAVGAEPSIAVLPFDNLGGDEATGRLADGLTEDVITDLARFRDLAVIARNSIMVYKGKPADIRQVGRDSRRVMTRLQREVSLGGGNSRKKGSMCPSHPCHEPTASPRLRYTQ